MRITLYAYWRQRAKNMKPPGITNGANLCYANSVVQCLLNHPVFNSYIQSMNDKDCKLCQNSG